MRAQADDIARGVASFAALEAQLAQEAQALARHLDRPHALLDPRAVDRMWSGIAAIERHYRQAVTTLNQPRAALLPGDPRNGLILRQAQRFGAERLALWPKVARLLARVVAGHHAPLVTTRSEAVTGRESGAVNNLMRLLAQAANPLASEQGRAVPGRFHDISLSGAHFLDLCGGAYRLSRALRLRRPLRFLDVGCGGGSKLVAASSFFEEAVGLEIDEGYVTNARDWLGRIGADGTRVIGGDALTFTGYADFDVIYFYRPFSDGALQSRLEEHILAQAGPGKILIAPLTTALHRVEPPACLRLCNALFLTGTSADQARSVLGEAETIGPDVALPDPTLAQRAGFWTPILETARDRGFVGR